MRNKKRFVIILIRIETNGFCEIKFKSRGKENLLIYKNDEDSRRWLLADVPLRACIFQCHYIHHGLAYLHSGSRLEMGQVGRVLGDRQDWRRRSARLGENRHGRHTCTSTWPFCIVIEPYRSVGSVLFE